jgi:hypothetical protein
MAKPTPLSPDDLTVQNPPPPAAAPPRAVVAKPSSAPIIPKEPHIPLQLRLPAKEAKAIKRAALEADQTISEFMLACFHARITRA